MALPPLFRANLQAHRLLWGLLLLTPFFIFPTLFPLFTLLATLLILLYLLNQWHKTNEPLLPNTPLTPPLLLLIGMVIIGTAVSADLSESLTKAANLFIGIIWWRELNNARQLSQSTLLQLFVALGLLFTLLGIATVDWPRDIPAIARLIPFNSNQLGQLPESPNGTHPNQLALTILLFILPSIALTLGSPTSSRRLAGGVISLVALVTLVFTQSRGGWLSLLIALFAVILGGLYLKSAEKNRRYWHIGLTISILLALIPLTIGFLELQTLWLQPNRSSAIGSLSTLQFRRELWPWAIQAIHDFPLTGVGLGSFDSVVHRLYPVAIRSSFDIAHAHNLFFQTALDVGLPGLIAYLALIGLALATAWQTAKQSADPAQRWLPLTLFGTLLAVHLFGILDSLSLGMKPALLFWWLLALITRPHAHRSLVVGQQTQEFVGEPQP